MSTVFPEPEQFQLSGYSSDRELLASCFHRSGRRVYVIALPLHLIPSHMPRPDPNRPFPGNRTVDPLHAKKFGEYWRSRLDWAAPPLLADTNADLVFQALYSAGGVELGILRLPQNATQIIETLDGQHRVLGWYLQIEKISQELRQAREELVQARRGQDPISISVAEDKLARLQELEQRLQHDFVAIELVEGVTTVEHRQAFADITTNAKGITKSKAVEFDSVSVFSRVTRMLAEDHELLQGRVDFNKDRTQGAGNPNFISARNVSDIVKHVALGIAGRTNPRREEEFTDDGIAALGMEFFDCLVGEFFELQEIAAGQKSPQELRETSLLGWPTMLRELAGAFHEVAVEFDGADVPRLNPDGVKKVRALFREFSDEMSAPVTGDGSLWFKTGLFEEGAMAPNARRQDIHAMVEVIAAWAEGVLPLFDMPAR